MVLEVAILEVRPGQEQAFEATFLHARQIIGASAGFLGLELQRCLESQGRYILLVRWRSLEDHTVGFRQSESYQRWKALLHHYYDPTPTVEHYVDV